MDPKDEFLCPFCGALVPAGAPACPVCGSDETTGWSDDLLGIRTANSAPESRPKKNPWGRIVYPLVVAVIILGLLQLPIRADALLGIILGICGITLVVAIGNGKSGRSGPSDEDDYFKLIRKANGDEELVKRLIEYERRKNPFRTQKNLIRDALERWEKDAR